MKGLVILLLISLFTTVHGQTAQILTAFDGKCMQCLLANATYDYCYSNLKCYDRTI
jgi:hypothetical protein